MRRGLPSFNIYVSQFHSFRRLGSQLSTRWLYYDPHITECKCSHQSFHNLSWESGSERSNNLENWYQHRNKMKDEIIYNFFFMPILFDLRIFALRRTSAAKCITKGIPKSNRVPHPAVYFRDKGFSNESPYGRRLFRSERDLLIFESHIHWKRRFNENNEETKIRYLSIYTRFWQAIWKFKQFFSLEDRKWQIINRTGIDEIGNSFRNFRHRRYDTYMCETMARSFVGR